MLTPAAPLLFIPFVYFPQMAIFATLNRSLQAPLTSSGRYDTDYSPFFIKFATCINRLKWKK